MSVVVVEKLPDGEYISGCVSLPRDYGKPHWESRPEVKAIRAAVFAALDKLDSGTGISGTGIGKRVRGKMVLVKPNLVLVYSGMGTVRDEYPETTDPRVLDALVLWALTIAGASGVTIVESSGRGSPTRVSFRASGIDRLARHRGCGLVALEEEPCDRYILPKAAVQREILVPRIFAPVIRGEAVYISVPKMKTNLYTQVTLGFKNTMGVIPYNLRQRNHHYALDRKLVEMLYLFKPDIVLVDGVVGGEGECPAPVDPVDSRMIIAGDHAVETDRVAARLMGFDPESIPLMRIADELGFGSPDPVLVLGDAQPVRFRPADRSLLSERVARAFPGIRILYGIDKVDKFATSDKSDRTREPDRTFGAGTSDSIDGAGDSQTGCSLPAATRETGPQASADAGSCAGSCSGFDVSPEFVRAVEASCLGGCVASTRFGLAMLEAEGFESGTQQGESLREERGGQPRRRLTPRSLTRLLRQPLRPGTIIIGGGMPARTDSSQTGKPVTVGDRTPHVRYWYDRTGRAYDQAAIEALPGKSAVIGSCGACLRGSVTYAAAGCMPLANAPHALIHAITGTRCRVLSVRNRHIPAMIESILKTRKARVGMLRRGIRFDVPFQTDEGPVETRALSADERGRDWVEWPLPPIADRAEMKRLIDFEDDSMIASLRGVIVQGVRARLFWLFQYAIATIMTLGPLAVGTVALALGRPEAAIWLAAFGAVEILHAAELPAALKVLSEKGPANSTAGKIARVMMTGYPAWLPYRLGVFGTGTSPGSAAGSDYADGSRSVASSVAGTGRDLA